MSPVLTFLSKGTLPDKHNEFFEQLALGCGGVGVGVGFVILLTDVLRYISRLQLSTEILEAYKTG